MTYEETLEYLYSQLAMFQRIGRQAYKAGLDTSIELDNYFNHPHTAYKCIHVGGTNGKGSVSHLLASILQQSGYKVGLYTSPHLIDFRERIRVNGQMIPKDFVVDFVERYKAGNLQSIPSFFELTMMMAFDYFRQEKVDYAVIEVGLGGRLDSTNIITPILSIITNISFDHTQFLGDTLPKIAAEKAGIIKHGIPVIIGAAEGEVKTVFENKAKEVNTDITFADYNPQIKHHSTQDFTLSFTTEDFGEITSPLSGLCQTENANTVLNAVKKLNERYNLEIKNSAVALGFKNVCTSTGLMGRWMNVSDEPTTVCDTGHNVGGIKLIVEQLSAWQKGRIHIVIGFVNDKDIRHILELLPTNAKYYFTQASLPRALDVHTLHAMASEAGLNGTPYATVAEAYNAAKNKAAPDADLIYIGGSTFVVADFLDMLYN